MARLCIVLADHGLGHLAQAAPVAAALRALRPDLELVLRTRLAPERLAAHFAGPFEHQRENPEVGMAMDSALDVDAAASFAAHARLHRHWAAAIEAEAQALAGSGADLVLANVSYLALAAAARAGITAYALCSLNWADVFGAYCRSFPGAAEIESQMRAAYAQAAGFLQPTPSMPMSLPVRTLPIGPIARVGRNRRHELMGRLGLAAGERLVAVSLGGVAMPLEFERWPRREALRWIVPRPVSGREDFIAFEELGMPFIDVLCSSDALVSKPGYGSFVEAALNDVPVLYTRRPQWPEEPCLVDWLARHGRCLELSRRDLEQGPAAALEALWAQPPGAGVVARGAAQAAAVLAAELETEHSD